MLGNCLGIYLVIALFTLLIFIGTFIDAQQNDDEAQESA